MKKYTTDQIFTKIVDILKEKGFYPEDILDYGNACSWKAVPIITEAWSPVFKLDYGGSEGIYLDVSLEGNITDPSKEEIVSIGTFKTLLESDEAMLKMAELQAHFIIEMYKFVNANLDDFTWYGGDVRIIADGKLTGYLSCGSLDKAFENAVKYNKEHLSEGKTAIVRNNITREWYYDDKKRIEGGINENA